jgi:hypothetical protein
MGFTDLNRVERLVDRLVYLQPVMRSDVTASDIEGWIRDVCRNNAFGCDAYKSFKDIASNYMSGIERVFVIKRNEAERYVQVKKCYDVNAFIGFSVSSTPSVSDFQERVRCGVRPDDDMVKQQIRTMLFESFGEKPPS